MMATTKGQMEVVFSRMDSIFMDIFGKPADTTGAKRSSNIPFSSVSTPSRCPEPDDTNPERGPFT